VIHIRENDKQDAHFFSLIYSSYTNLYMFRTNNCSSSGGVFLYTQHTVLYHASVGVKPFHSHRVSG